MSLLELREVSFAVGGQTLLAPMTVAFHAGRCTALLGPNGSGKTTLFRIAAGLLQATTGSREGVPPRALGYCPQADPLWPDLTAREHLELVAGLHGVAVAEARGRATELLTLLDLLPHAAKQAATLSGGMRRRLAVATALVHRPQCLLLDEPFAGLDAPQTARLEALLAELVKAGASVVVATHDLDQAARIADHLLLLREGRLLHDGSVASLRAKAPSHLLELALPSEAAGRLLARLAARGIAARTTEEGLSVAGDGVAALQALATELLADEAGCTGLEIRPVGLDDLLDGLRP